MSRCKKAIAYFSKALEQDPSRKQSLYEFIRLNSQEGNNQIALSYLKKYAELFDGDKNLIELAIKICHQAEQYSLEQEYRTRLATLSQEIGEKNEYHDRSTG